MNPTKLAVSTVCWERKTHGCVSNALNDDHYIILRLGYPPRRGGKNFKKTAKQQGKEIGQKNMNTSAFFIHTRQCQVNLRNGHTHTHTRENGANSLREGLLWPREACVFVTTSKEIYGRDILTYAFEHFVFSSRLCGTSQFKHIYGSE